MIFKTNNHFKQSYYFLESSRGTLQTFRVRNHKGKTQLAAATVHQFSDQSTTFGPLKTPGREWCSHRRSSECKKRVIQKFTICSFF